MTTNKISFISVMFVVGIIYFAFRITILFDLLDLLYQLLLIVCFIKFKKIRKKRMQEE